MDLFVLPVNRSKNYKKLIAKVNLRSTVELIQLLYKLDEK